mmetsp:Transcript_27797/g.64497  ORF Transcript_27797/g.64497 Transcript_27797/m.64497 type:complete len:289 (-) Transcript_27797:610-1476(-)
MRAARIQARPALVALHTLPALVEHALPCSAVAPLKLGTLIAVPARARRTRRVPHRLEAGVPRAQRVRHEAHEHDASPCSEPLPRFRAASLQRRNRFSVRHIVVRAPLDLPARVEGHRVRAVEPELDEMNREVLRGGTLGGDDPVASRARVVDVSKPPGAVVGTGAMLRAVGKDPRGLCECPTLALATAPGFRLGRRDPKHHIHHSGIRRVGAAVSPLHRSNKHVGNAVPVDVPARHGGASIVILIAAVYGEAVGPVERRHLNRCCEAARLPKHHIHLSCFVNRVARAV